MGEGRTRPQTRTAMANILIVDDESSFANGLAEYLELKGHRAIVAQSLAEARDALADGVPTVVLLDLMLPDGSGLELLDALEQNPPRKVIIMTGHSGVKSLIVTMAGEGVMYMKKPIEPRELLTVLSTLGDDSSGGSADGDSGHFGLLLGESPGMHAVYKQIRQVGVTDSTVLIRGESGTGKELVAEAIHRVSARQGRFIAVNCGGLARDLIASQLFGHEKGSFTGADRRHAGY
jgi:DNA-binding NtrC family response regulator